MFKVVPIDKVFFKHDPWRSLHDFVRETKAGGGINAGFFERINHPHGSTPLGMIAWEGKAARNHGYPSGWWDPAAFWHGVIKRYGEDPKIERSPQSNWQYPTIDSVEWAIGMGPIVLMDGNIALQDPSRFPGVNPWGKVQRSGFGITDDGKAIFAYLESATASEMARYLKDAGARDGILADGGSSASYADEHTVKGTQLLPNALLFESEAPSVPVTPNNPISEAKVLLARVIELLDEAGGPIVKPPAVGVTPPAMVRPNYAAHGGWTVNATNHYMNPKGVRYLVLHHDGNPVHQDTSAETINGIHRGRGWAGIGYHAWIRWNGTIQEGRPLDRRGAHVGEVYNPISWGAAIAGNYDIAREVPKDAWESAVHLFAYWQTLQPDAIIMGDGELTGSTNCPGRHIDMDKFRADVRQYLAQRGV